mmetsp:Transcript_32215/g.96932  ORF Transcript_32215/g.96932 Transcript_32215/m.96932 type:complete len:344 (-) Transcript_32215:265-1296(-)
MPAAGMGKKVLVSGVSGFIGGHCALALLEKGYEVRGTVRSLTGAAAEHLRTHAVLKNVELVAADLLADEGWDAAAAGCDAVLHVASPFPIGSVEKDSLTRPAVEGTERALRAAAKAGIKRVVVTSSVVAVASGRTDKVKRVFTESDHTNLDHCEEYPRSKTLAEQRAWALADELGLEVATINPSYVIGPLISARDCSSAVLVRRLLSGDLPAVPKIFVPSVDVRDVAAAHVAALESSDAPGKRYILDSGAPLWMPEIAKLLKKEFGPRGFKVPTTPAPWALVALISLWDAGARAVRSSIGDDSTRYANDRAKALLGRGLVGPEASYVAMGESMISLGVVKAKA